SDLSESTVFGTRPSQVDFPTLDCGRHKGKPGTPPKNGRLLAIVSSILTTTPWIWGQAASPSPIGPAAQRIPPRKQSPVFSARPPQAERSGLALPRVARSEGSRGIYPREPAPLFDHARRVATVETQDDT